MLASIATPAPVAVKPEPVTVTSDGDDASTLTGTTEAIVLNQVDHQTAYISVNSSDRDRVNQADNVSHTNSCRGYRAVEGGNGCSR